VSTKQYNISDLTWDQSIYPRSGKSQKTIETYVEALKAGAEFPAIRIQKVFNYPVDGVKRDAALIIDGLHRFFAFMESGRKEIPAIELDVTPLDYEENRVSLLLESANANITHGDRLKSNDEKRVAWDQWNFNECDERFGDEWPGRIPAQLVAHTLYYFTKPGDFILDPMAGGGVVPDVCVLFKRRCRAFDLAPAENRLEINHHY
jgi:hypothetical protein